MAKVGRSGWVRLIGQGWMIWLVSRCGYGCRSRGGCGWVWTTLGIYGQRWAKVGRSRWVRLIRWGIVICLVGGCGYAEVGVGWCGQFLTDMGKAMQRWAGLDGSD